MQMIEYIQCYIPLYIEYKHSFTILYLQYCLQILFITKRLIITML